MPAASLRRNAGPAGSDQAASTCSGATWLACMLGRARMRCNQPFNAGCAASSGAPSGVMDNGSRCGNTAMSARLSVSGSACQAQRVGLSVSPVKKGWPACRAAMAQDRLGFVECKPIIHDGRDFGERVQR
jgi:hypothetical protein